MIQIGFILPYMQCPAIELYMKLSSKTEFERTISKALVVIHPYIFKTHGLDYIIHLQISMVIYTCKTRSIPMTDKRHNTESRLAASLVEIVTQCKLYICPVVESRAMTAQG